MKTCSAKNKGRRGGLEAAELIRKRFNFSEQDVYVVPSGVPGEDVLLSHSASQKFPYSIEVKNVEKLNIWKAIGQAVSNETQERPFILFFKRNRSEMYVALRAETFLERLKND